MFKSQPIWQVCLFFVASSNLDVCTLLLPVCLFIGTDCEGKWKNVWQQFGDQGVRWMKAEVPLEALEGSSVALRLRATVGSGKLGQSWLSDIAIDDIKWSASACNVSADVVKATTNVAGCPNDRPFLSTGTGCVEVCPPTHYGDVGKTFRCVACNNQCATSTASSNRRILAGNTGGGVGVMGGMVGCTGPGPSNCRKCKAVKEGETCKDACSLGLYKDESGTCQKCDGQCDSASGCTGYGAGKCVKCANVAEDGKCVAACSANRFAESASSTNAKTCVMCDANCDTSKGCSGPGPKACTLCRKVQEEDGSCVAACPAAGKYVDVSKSPGRCTQCHTECDQSLSCTDSSASSCKACANFKDGLVCVSACPPAGKYADPSKQCFACSSECKTQPSSASCTGGEANQCTECANVKDLKYCRASCPAGKTVNAAKTCDAVVTCAAGQYSNAAGKCAACSGECDASKSCFGSSSSECEQCKTVQDGGECKGTCPTGKYSADVDAAGSWKACFACDPLCDSARGCTGKGPGQCDACASSAVTHNGVCVQSCPAGLYNNQDAAAPSCAACDAQCTSNGCTGPGPTQCKQCLNVLDESTCVQSCPSAATATAAAKYSDGYNCQSCDMQCDATGCVGAGPGACRACKNVNNGGTCAASCPVGTCLSVSVSQCLSSISYPNISLFFRRACDSSTRNLICVVLCVYTLLGITRDVHATGTYKDALSKACQKCDAQCDATGCGAYGPSECRSCASVSDRGTCRSSCPVGTFTDNFSSPPSCLACSGQCDNSVGCVGGGPSKCKACSRVKDGAACASACPAGKYEDTSTKECVASSCPTGQYADIASGAPVCTDCDTQCAANGGCTGKGPTKCVSCASNIDGDTCVASCPSGKVPNAAKLCTAKVTCPSGKYRDSDGLRCFFCNALCDPSKSCSGPAATQCDACRSAKSSSSASASLCLNQCPTGEVVDANAADKACIAGAASPTDQSSVGEGTSVVADSGSISEEAGANACVSTFVSPNTTTVLAHGVDTVLRWTTLKDGNVDDVCSTIGSFIELYRDHYRVATVTTSVTTEGTYTWKVPESVPIGSGFR